MYEKTGPGALVLYVARSLPLARREVGKKSLVPPEAIRIWMLTASVPDLWHNYGVWSRGCQGSLSFNL